MKLFSFLDGWKTYMGATGMFGLSLHLFSQGEFITAIHSLMVSIIAYGVKNAFARHADATNAQLKLMKAHLVEMHQQSQIEKK